MGRRTVRKRKTDTGTIILHWTLVITLTVSITTGLRIAMDSPEQTWLVALDSFLPLYTVWTTHIPAAVILVAVSLAYFFYMKNAGLMRRIRIDRARLTGLFRSGQARWGSINVLLYWVLFGTMIMEIATGSLLWFGYGRGIWVTLHWWGMWIIIGYAVAHILAHFAVGGATQLMRVFRPTKLAPPPPPFDPFDLLDFAQPDEPAPKRRSREQTAPARGRAQSRDQFAPARDDFAPRNRAPSRDLAPSRDERQPDGRQPQRKHKQQPARSRGPGGPPRSGRRHPAFHVNPFVAAGAAALTAVMFVMAMDRASEDTLTVRRIAKQDAPILDGDLSDAVWRTTTPFVMFTELGGNYDGKGETSVEIRAVNDGEWAYFCFVWDDPTRSLKHLPLIKQQDGWHVLHDRFDVGDERSYFEDKFSVLLTKLPLVIPGDRTYHAGPTPIEGKPATLSKRGLHFTPGPNLDVEVWQWKASSGGLLGWIDRNHFDVPAEPTQPQVAGLTPYRGGFIQDPRTAELYQDNFDLQPVGGYERPIPPRRLPKDWQATEAALGKIDLDPHHGDSEGARWWMTMGESEPYSPELDAQIPVGTVIPGSLILVDDLVDRADIKGAAHWAAGRWTLEAARRLDAKSPDVPISTGTYMRVSVFDHTQIYHTRHIRPIRLIVE